MNEKKQTKKVFALIAAGTILFVLGFGSASLFLSRGGPDVSGEHGEHENLYTCGMHPNVIQKGPGLCPICKMDLTPIQSSSNNNEGGERIIKYWVAPMDPAFISDKPGKSPMGMDLVPVYEDEVESERAVVIDPMVVQNIGVRTAGVTRGLLARTIRATGEVIEDETKIGIVNLKIAGWIEKVIVDETGQSVRAGDPLLEIYSPQLVATQGEYLIAWNNLNRVRGGSSKDAISSAERTLESTRRRLLYWDITREQIRELEESKTVKKTMLLRSPFTGVVTMKNALPGQKVVPGTDLYHIADLSTIWVEASVFDADLPYIRIGQDATMDLTYIPGKSFSGRVTFISPVLNAKTRDLKIRLEFPNHDGALKPGMYANVVIRSTVDEDATLIPGEAVIHSGKRTVVFVTREEGRFIPTDIVLGPQGEDNLVQVLAGLVPGERVVTSAQFLLDSESSFQEALRKMIQADGEKDRGGKTGTAVAAHTTHADPGRSEDRSYTPIVEAMYQGRPIANAVAIEPDGSITIVCPVMKGTATVKEGDSYSEYEGMRVYYCCPGCKANFDQDPESYIAELETAIRSAR